MSETYNPNAFEEEEDPGRGERLALMNRIYGIFPELGSTLNKALTQGTGEEAMEALNRVQEMGRSDTVGVYKMINFDNPQNGRRFTLKIFEKPKEQHRFVKDEARFSFTVSYTVADFEK